MKILWISPFLLHPTRAGGQIRSLGILRQLHRRHRIHVLAFQLPGQEEGVARMSEYCSSADRIAHTRPDRGSVEFLLQALGNTISRLPLTIARDRSSAMQRLIRDHAHSGGYDVIVCDFVSMAINVPDMQDVVLFQHNVETVIWHRMADESSSRLRRWNYRQQAQRMCAFERNICRTAKHVIAVSEPDAELMRTMFGVSRVTSVSTGVDVDFFRPPDHADRTSDLVFTGSLNWIPNIDGLAWFIAEVLPRIRERKPDCTLAVVGRRPGPEIHRLVGADPRILLRADVPDIRPYLWGARAAVVPLKVGGGTRLKIYEAMAAGTPQISTVVGAEGLVAEHGKNILLADSAEEFAAACLLVLEQENTRKHISESALQMVTDRFGWAQVGGEFEQILEGTLAGRQRT